MVASQELGKDLGFVSVVKKGMWAQPKRRGHISFSEKEHSKH